MLSVDRALGAGSSIAVRLARVTASLSSFHSHGDASSGTVPG
jgi:hypothetical protein